MLVVSLRRAILVAACGVALSSSTLFAVPTLGEYKGDGATFEFNVANNDDVSGGVEIGGKRFPWAGVSKDTAGGAVIKGTFTANEKQYPFTATFEGKTANFETQGNVYKLKLAGDDADDNNPFKKGNAGENVNKLPDVPVTPTPTPTPSPVPPNSGRGEVPAGQSFGGVGIALAKGTGGWAIAGLKPGGPAEKGGLLEGQMIVAVSGKPTADMKMEEVGMLLRGPVGSDVTVTVLSQGAPKEVRLVREEIRATPAVGLEAYQSPTGLYSLRVPTAGWTKEEAPDGSTVTWKHTSGAMLFVTLVPNVPFKDGATFFAQGIKPGLTQSGAQITNEGDEPNGHGAFFRRQRNGVNELGQSRAFVVNGTGVIVQMLLPESQMPTLGDTFREIADSVRVGAAR